MPTIISSSISATTMRVSIDFSTPRSSRIFNSLVVCPRVFCSGPCQAGVRVRPGNRSIFPSILGWTIVTSAAGSSSAVAAIYLRSIRRYTLLLNPGLGGAACSYCLVLRTEALIGLTLLPVAAKSLRVPCFSVVCPSLPHCVQLGAVRRISSILVV